MKSTISLGVGYIALLKDCVFVLQLFFLASVRVCFELQPHSYVQVSLLVYFCAVLCADWWKRLSASTPPPSQEIQLSHPFLIRLH